MSMMRKIQRLLLVIFFLMASGVQGCFASQPAPVEEKKYAGAVDNLMKFFIEREKELSSQERATKYEAMKKFIQAIARIRTPSLENKDAAALIFERLFNFFADKIYDICLTSFESRETASPISLGKTMALLRQELQWHAFIVSCFLKNGLNVNVVYEKSRKTPLMDAVEKNFGYVAEVLFNHEDCKWQRRVDEKSARDYLKVLVPQHSDDIINTVGKLPDPELKRLIAKVKDQKLQPTRWHVGLCQYQGMVVKALQENKELSFFKRDPRVLLWAPFCYLQQDHYILRLFEVAKKDKAFDESTHKVKKQDEQDLKNWLDDERGGVDEKSDDGDDEVIIVDDQKELFHLMELFNTRWVLVRKCTLKDRKASIKQCIKQSSKQMDFKDSKVSSFIFEHLINFFIKQVVEYCEELKEELKTPQEIMKLLLQELKFHAWVVDYFIKKGLCVNVVYPTSGKTPLIHAVEEHLAYVVGVLLKWGVDWEKMVNGKTARGHLELLIPFRRIDCVDKIVSDEDRCNSLTDMLVSQEVRPSRKNLGFYCYQKIVKKILEENGKELFLAPFYYLEHDHLIAKLFENADKDVDFDTLVARFSSLTV